MSHPAQQRAVLRLFALVPGMPDMDIIVYGVEAHDLMTVPNEVIQRIATKYPGYQGSMFHVRNLPKPI